MIFDFVECINFIYLYISFGCRGLDNSGKTTIVLKINGEDTSVISPTLGFNIKTLTYQKLVTFLIIVLGVISCIMLYEVSNLL